MRPIQEYPAHPGKQNFRPGPGRVRIPCGGYNWAVFTKGRVICQPLLSRCNDRADAKKIRRHGAKPPKLVVFHFCPTVQLPIWSTLWYFTFEYLSQLGMETTKKVRKAVPCLFDIEILRLAASFGCLFGCISVVPIKVTETLVQWVARNVLEIQTARLGQEFFSKPGLFLNS